MATDTKTETETKASEKTKAVDYLAQIGGNLHQANAREIFGERWLDALKATATAAYGTVDPASMQHEFFGGLQMPTDIENQTAADAARIAGQRAAINRALNELN